MTPITKIIVAIILLSKFSSLNNVPPITQEKNTDSLFTARTKATFPTFTANICVYLYPIVNSPTIIINVADFFIEDFKLGIDFFPNAIIGTRNINNVNACWKNTNASGGIFKISPTITLSKTDVMLKQMSASNMYL